MKKKWFHLKSDIFLWQKSKNGLIYNSKNKFCFPFSITDKLEGIISELLNIDNLYSILVSQDILDNDSAKDFTKKIQDSDSGIITLNAIEQIKPIFLPPKLNLQSDLERLKKDDELSVGNNILTYLNHVNLQLKRGGVNIQIDSVKGFLDSIKRSSIGHINILGYDVLNYPDLNQFIDEIDRMAVIKTFCISVDKFPENIEQLRVLESEQFLLKVLVTENYIATVFKRIVPQLKKTDIKVEWEFSITSEDGYEKVDELIQKWELENTEIKPIYNGDNLQFFEDHIYLTEEDLKTPGLSKREVFAHQALNTNDFGKLTITADGKVYANPHFPALGTIEDDIRELVYKEMTEGKSWLRIRDMKPCSDCVYQWLCPSPSNYELAIGKPNLCHVKP